MRVFDLTNTDAYTFPIKAKFDLNGNLYCFEHGQTATIKISSDLFYVLIKENVFIILMKKETKPGIRKYRCEVDNYDNKTFTLSFRFYLVGELSKQECRQRTIKNIINEI